MGTITSGIGLVSGLNIQELVGKLIALESGPSKQLQAKIDNANELQSAFQTISLRIVGANLTASQLGKGGAFVERTASASSNAVSVSAGKGAALGSFQFTPRRLVGTSQVLSSGYNTATTSIASTATTLKIAQGGFVDDSTTLSTLNGGAGVRVGSIKVTDAAGASSVVDLTGAVTVRDVVEAINGSTGANVQARTNGDRLELVDLSAGGGTLNVSNVAGGQTATDLGLTSLTQAGSTYTGQDVYSLGSGLALGLLRDGNGVRQVTGNDFTVTVGSLSFNVDLDDTSSLGDVLDAINNNVGNTGGRVSASLVGDRIQLSDTAGPEAVSVAAIGGSLAAQDLGLLNGSGSGGVLTGDDILGSLDTVLLATLNGGSATATATPGTLIVNGNNIDLSAATTLDDVIKGINNAAISGVTASLNDAGNGVKIRAVGAGSLTIADSTGNLASFLNIAGSASGSDVAIDSGDLNRQYVNDNTRLSDYGSSAGVPAGKFRITDGNGDSAVVDLTQSGDDTIGDVLREINTRGLAVSARINDTGDGILIEKTGGTDSILVTEVDGGTTAKALRLLKSPNGSGGIDGSLEVSVDIAAGTTLTGLVTVLKEAGAPVQASIINDGSSLNPFRLSLTSNRSGRAGRLLIDPGASSLSFSTTSQGQDAVLLYGASGPGVSPVQVVSSSNTFGGLVPGVQVTAKEVANSPVTVSVSENNQSVAEALRSFVEDYNSIREYLDENGSFDPQTLEKGLLFTDNTARQVQRQLVNFVTTAFQGTGSNIKTLGEVGLALGSDGLLTLDEGALNAALAEDPEDVKQFFTATGTGFVAKFQILTDALTRAGDGILSARTNTLSDTIERQSKSLDSQVKRLEAKETRLFNQFYAMEQALSAFQSQQSTLTQLATLANSFRAQTRG